MVPFDVTVAWHRKSNDNPIRVWLTKTLEMTTISGNANEISKEILFNPFL